MTDFERDVTGHTDSGTACRLMHPVGTVCLRWRLNSTTHRNCMLLYMFTVAVNCNLTFLFVCKIYLWHFVYATFHWSKCLIGSTEMFKWNETEYRYASVRSTDWELDGGTWLCFYNIHTAVFALRASVLHCFLFERPESCISWFLATRKYNITASRTLPSPYKAAMVKATHPADTERC